ncbi:MAG: hypothetical protein NXI16_12075 [Alphaproteobacteria bacterium]|nr:hypothetical protein [Alphaproteobacteria bacterium]
MSRFDAILALDWSGAKGRYTGIAIAELLAEADSPRLVRPSGARWTRAAAAAYLLDRIAAGERLLITIDCAFSMPYLPDEGYLQARTPGIDRAPDLWALLDAAARDAPDFAIGPMLDDPRMAPSYWASGKQPADWKGEKRLTERACAEATGTRPETVFKLVGAKQVGKASLTGMRTIHHMRKAEPDRLSVWPFEERETQAVMAEIYPTLFRRQAAGTLAKITDAATLSGALAALDCGPARGVGATLSDHEGDALITAAGLRRFLATSDTPFALPVRDRDRVCREGWILGVPPCR